MPLDMLYHKLHPIILNANRSVNHEVVNWYVNITVA